MKVSFPYYVVALVVGFLYALAKYYWPALPLTEEQLLWAIVTILTLLGVDVTQSLRSRGLL